MAVSSFCREGVAAIALKIAQPAAPCDEPRILHEAYHHANNYTLIKEILSSELERIISEEIYVAVISIWRFMYHGRRRRRVGISKSRAEEEAAGNDAAGWW